jgi:hypothetical protein
MSETEIPPDSPPPSPSSAAIDAGVATKCVLPKEVEQLPPEMKTMVSLMAGIFRSTSGPDPETSRIVAESEMHEESCRLEGYKESLKTKDKQNERDHAFRMKRLNHETLRSMVITSICVVGICTGLYLLVVRKDETLGSSILIACFMALLGGGKSLFQKDRD